jgi:deazaflavin-dependent oxidoreductase (nitroreductase family)
VLLFFRLGCVKVKHIEISALDSDLRKGSIMSARYDEPNRAAKTANALIRWLAEAGISIAGTRALRVRGRKTGQVRSVVVNVLTVDDRDYLVSPRGATQWVRNVRATGTVEVGPRWRRRKLQASEVGDAAKPELIRRYLDRWYWEVKGHIAGLSPDSNDEQLAAAAPSIPVFALAGIG